MQPDAQPRVELSPRDQIAARCGAPDYVLPNEPLPHERRDPKEDPISYKFKNNVPVAERVAEIIEDQFHKSIEELEDEELPIHEQVHQVRKRFKKIRAMLRLARDPLGGTLQGGECLLSRRRASALRDP